MRRNHAGLGAQAAQGTPRQVRDKSCDREPRGEGRPLSERDRWLASRIGPAMRERGMMFVGLDVIGDYVTEINVTSPTGIRELDKQFKLDIGALLMDAIARRLATHRSR